MVKACVLVGKFETVDRCGEVDARTKRARKPNRTHGLMSQEVSKRCEESKVSVPKAKARRRLKETIVGAQESVMSELWSRTWLHAAVVCCRKPILKEALRCQIVVYRL